MSMSSETVSTLNPRLILFSLLSILSLSPIISTPIALTMGLMFGLFFGCPEKAKVGKLTQHLLKISVVILGFGIPIRQVLETGREGIFISLGSISFVLVLGFVLTKIFKIQQNTATLITFGTAICGGSAIAAIAPVIKAKPEEISVSLASVFSLNALALFIFPWIGHQLNMQPEQFGLWSALAIHDTSSVVGAASVFGPIALTIGTTVKLSRALWILPCVAALAVVKKSQGKITIPWFIFLFIIAAALRSLIPSANNIFDTLSTIGRQCLCLVLFWIGAGLDRSSLSAIGWRPFIVSISLWVACSVVFLIFVMR